MHRFLQILLGLGTLAFVSGIFLAFTHQEYFITAQGYWRGAIGFWMLLIATRMTYSQKTQ